MYGIEPVDELTHEAHGDPAWRESYWIDVVDPAQGIGVLAYAGSQPMAGTGYSLIHVARPGEILYQHREFGLALPERYESGRSSIEIGPFASEVTKALERQAVRYGRDGFSLDLGFGSSAPVYDYPWPWTRSRHWEQFGDVAGSLVLDGQHLQINGRGVRDHAWGLRSLRPWRRWLWTTFRASDGGPAWSLCMVEDDERDGLYGYLLDDDGGVHTLRRLEAEIAYDGEAPGSVSLRFACGKRDPIEVSATLFGLINLSHQDAAKQGGYFFSFLEVESERLRGFGTFDVFWRHDLPRPERFEHGL